MCRSTIPWKQALATCVLMLTASALQAQETIKWRTDYNQARKEAEAKNLPMLIDFITVPCYHCSRMDQQTFTNARMITTTNERFIPLKINYSEDRTLADHLKIDLFPTIVLASPAGLVIDKRIGFHDADTMNELLQQTLAKLTPPDALQEKYTDAVKYEAAGEYGQAIRNLRDIVEDPKVRPITKSAQDLLVKIGKRADDRLFLAKELQSKGKSAEALEAYTDIQRLFPSMPASREAQDLVNRSAQNKPELVVGQRTKTARDLMNQAKDFYKSEDYIPCLHFCNKILRSYGDLPEGPEAAFLASSIKNNRQWMQKAADVMTDQLGGMYLAIADSHLKAGEVRLAQMTLQRVITAFPGTRLAESAQIRLNQLQGTVPIRNDLARP